MCGRGIRSRVFAVLCLAGSLRAQEDAALAAFEKGDTAALRAMAEKDDPDPWVVADRLCAAGKHEAALALARVSDRPSLAALAAHVEEWPQHAEARIAGRKAAIEADAALARGDVDRAAALVRAADRLSVGSILVRYSCGCERLKAGQARRGRRAQGRAGARARAGEVAPPVLLGGVAALGRAGLIGQRGLFANS